MEIKTNAVYKEIIEIREALKNKREFTLHGISFIASSNPLELLLFYFRNEDLYNFVKKNMNYYSKITLCEKIIEEIVFKRIILNNKNYIESITDAIKAAVEWFFDFKTITPLLGIKKLYQENIEKGNYISLIINDKIFEQDFLPVLVTLHLAKNVRKILNANIFKINEEEVKNIAKNLYKKFNLNNAYLENLLMNFIRDINEGIYINILEDKENKTSLEFIIEKIILLSCYNYPLIETLLIDINEIYLFNTLNKYKNKLLKKLSLKLLPKKYLITLNPNEYFFNEEEKSNIKKFLQLTSKYNRYIEKYIGKKIYDGEHLATYILSNHIDKIDSMQNEKITLYELTESINNKNLALSILPIEIKNNLDKEIETHLKLFYCNKCREITPYETCYKHKVSNKVVYFCKNCNKFTKNEICGLCNSSTIETYNFKINYLKEIEKFAAQYNLSLDKEKFNFREEKINYLEFPLKIILKSKYNITVNEFGVIEMQLKVLPFYEKDYKELEPNEIIAPKNLIEQLENALEYINEEMKKIFDIETNNYAKDVKDLILLIRNPVNYICYPVKIKKVIDKEVGYLHPKLFDLICHFYSTDNTLKIHLYLDVLLNYSAFFKQNENGQLGYLISFQEFPEIMDIKEEKIKHAAFSYETIEIQSKEEEPIEKLQTYYFLRNILIENINRKLKETIKISVKCKNCGKEYRRLPIFSICYNCRNKINIKWFKTIVAEDIAMLEKSLNEYKFEQFKKQNRKIRKLIKDYFKEEEKLEKLDKFF